MADTVTFSCVIDNTNADCSLGIEIWLDDQPIYNNPHVNGATVFEHQIPDVDGHHQLKWIMKGKTSDHTKIDDSGAIVSDARLVIKDIAFDEIVLGQMVTDLAVYTHDFNGTGQLIQDKFYKEIGCNGTVSLEFNTPIYLWLLEHM